MWNEGKDVKQQNVLTANDKQYTVYGRYTAICITAVYTMYILMYIHNKLITCLSKNNRPYANCTYIASIENLPVNSVSCSFDGSKLYIIIT